MGATALDLTIDRIERRLRRRGDRERLSAQERELVADMIEIGITDRRRARRCDPGLAHYDPD